ncbi:hypothetical protein [Aquimarina sp. 2201CG5-10]|uniref:hypothetical protein n=1 Tax=Aquimarina callyspongiae TaxID=3098150 RepID=UPI002AB50FB0|nr:hypothetical protein [Aquimarina sp. 2201CG5-10]MDY8138532.1 hypothetical protein [Aquimarina sp. 2201CG5-10]
MINIWNPLIGGQEKKEAISKHLSFLCKNEDDIKALHKIMNQFIKATADNDRLLLTFQHALYDDDEVIIECLAPFTGDQGPKSWVEVANIHNGIFWESLGGGYIGFNGLQEKGYAIDQSWEYEALEEAEEENSEFIESLTKHGYGTEDTEGIIDYGQNWVIAHPGKMNQLNEPTLYFVSYGDCEAVLIQKAQNMTMGQVLLRMIAAYILDEDYFSEIYN